MASLLNNLFGGSQASPSPSPAADDADFADFAGAPDPSPASISASIATEASPAPAFATGVARPYTKWYRVWERTSPADFYQELFILPFIVVVLVVHLWGTRANRRKAQQWMAVHVPVLEQEFAAVGFGGRKAPSLDDVQGSGLRKAADDDGLMVPEELLREKSANQFETYATGRQNVAFLDVKLTLVKRYNPLVRFGEALLAFFFESMPATEETLEATAYAFDGKEKDLTPARSGAPNSSYDQFVWALVHKESMKKLRDDRYDLSLTFTKDHAKLPLWATVMSESAEVTEALLTPELIKAVEQAGEALEALIVSDQPQDAPRKLDDTVPRKRVQIILRVGSSSSYASTLPLFHYFVRMTDQLVARAHFRPEVMRKIRGTREDAARKIKKVDEDEKAEERRLQADKMKKEQRDRKLKGMTADEQRKFLEKEREKDIRKGEKRRTMRA